MIHHSTLINVVIVHRIMGRMSYLSIRKEVRKLKNEHGQKGRGCKWQNCRQVHSCSTGSKIPDHVEKMLCPSIRTTLTHIDQVILDYRSQAKFRRRNTS